MRFSELKIGARFQILPNGAEYEKIRDDKYERGGETFTMFSGDTEVIVLPCRIHNYWDGGICKLCGKLYNWE